jgi:hypothetical protein
MAVKLELERRAREQRDRVLALIAEFGGQKPERMLVPEDDPANNELVLRLTEEMLFSPRPDPTPRQCHGARAGRQAVRAAPTRPVRATGR